MGTDESLIGRRVTLRGLPHVVGTIVEIVRGDNDNEVYFQVSWDDPTGMAGYIKETEATILNPLAVKTTEMSNSEMVLRANAVVDAEWTNFRLNVHDYNQLRQAILEYALA